MNRKQLLDALDTLLDIKETCQCEEYDDRVDEEIACLILNCPSQ